MKLLPKDFPEITNYIHWLKSVYILHGKFFPSLGLLPDPPYGFSWSKMVMYNIAYPYSSHGAKNNPFYDTLKFNSKNMFSDEFIDFLGEYDGL